MEKNVQDSQVPQNPRFVIQIFNIDTNQANPVQDSFAVTCPTGTTAIALFESLQRILQAITQVDMKK